MAGKPIIPRSKGNPVGQVRRIRKAGAAVTRQLKPVRKFLRDWVKSLSYERLTVNASKYEYQVSTGELQQVVDQIALKMLENSSHTLIANEASAAYQEGTAQSVTNLANISDDYTREITQVLASAPYQKRSALVAARVFEEMKGFDADASRALGRTLRQAIEDGESPTAITGKLSEQFGITKKRAERIARTEITGALRRGRWDEAQDAQTRLDIRTKLMHLSALSPTTRVSHEARHGRLFSVQEVREFYSQDANGINCKCTQVEVLVDADGVPLTKGAVDQQRKRVR